MVSISESTHSSSSTDSLKFSHMCNISEPTFWLKCIDFVSFFFSFHLKHCLPNLLQTVDLIVGDNLSMASNITSCD